MDCAGAAHLTYVVHFGTAVLALAAALILFKLFPKSEASVEGPLGTIFGELRLKAGGAIAGFLIVFIIMVLLTPNINKTLMSKFCENLERWTFTVPVYVLDENGKIYRDISQLEEQIKIELKESIWKIPKGNKLEFSYPVDPNNLTDRLKHLSIHIAASESGDGESIYVHDPGTMDIIEKTGMFIVDEVQKRVAIVSPIIIKRWTQPKALYSEKGDREPQHDKFADKPEPKKISADE